jgi:hypothetical protein
MGDKMVSNITQIGPVAERAVTEDSIGEYRLWTAVIIKAIEDWRSGTLRARREAQKFLFEDSRDFFEVCASAGLDPVSFRAQLLKIGRRIAVEGPYLHPIAA